MKKLILMATMMVAAMTAGAQARFEQGTLTLQPRIGGTGSQFTNAIDATSPDGGKVEATAAGGSFVGVDLEYYLTRRIGLAAGVNWSETGIGWEKYDYNNGGVKYKVKETTEKPSYIGVPLTASWYVARGLAVKTGVQMGFLVSAKNRMRTEYSIAGTDYTLTEESDVKDDYKKFDVMIPIGLSYDFKLPFVIDFRFNIGVTKVNDYSFGDDFRNMQAVLTLGYKFRL